MCRVAQVLGGQQPATELTALLSSRPIGKRRARRMHPTGTRERPHKGSDDKSTPVPNAWLSRDKPRNGSPRARCLWAGLAKGRQASGSEPAACLKGPLHHGFSLSRDCFSACLTPGNFRPQHFSPEKILAIDLGIDIAK